MFVIKRESDKTYTVVCNFVPEFSTERKFLYSIKNLLLPDVARFMLGRGNEDLDGEITVLFEYTNVTRAYISDTGRLTAVLPS